MYDLFDSGHEGERWINDHPLVARQGKGADDCCPVVNVTFFNVWRFARWCGCRLPGELEWEHACRAGTTTAYSFGNELNGRQANCDGEHPCGTSESGPFLGNTSIVGSYPPNAWGLFDMHGNVWEWCASCVNQRGSARVLRGGSWRNDAGFCRSAFRIRFGPGIRLLFYGFRLAAVPVGAKQDRQADA